MESKVAHKVRIIERDDTLLFELPSSIHTGFKAGNDVVAQSVGGDALLLLKEAPKNGSFFAGDLSAFTVAELFGQMVGGLRTGKLLLAHGAVRKTVSFLDGQVVFATSSEPHQRLGAALVRLGLVDEAKLTEALKKVGPKQKLGQVLRGSGLITAAKLYGAMTFIVREIVVDLFSMTDGTFLFLEGVLPPDTLKLAERTRDLVLEGMARSEKKVREKRMRELEQRKTERPFVESKAQAYVDFIRDVAVALKAAPSQDGADLSDFFTDAPPEVEPLFKDVKLGSDGVLDLKTLQLNAHLPGGGEDAARGRTYDALWAFASYALFTAKNVLTEEASGALEEKARKLPESGP